jgi:6-pyruvoyltetrahydropterin/6-carboxytetrahydropterin synthase
MCKIPVRLTKHVEFEASHKLIHYSGPCERLHGHTYKLEVTIEGIPDSETGLVIDFKDLKSKINDEILSKVDHEYLNQVMADQFNMNPNENTTCENMIIAFWYALDHVISETDGNNHINLQELKLWETSSSFATLTRDMVYGG